MAEPLTARSSSTTTMQIGEAVADVGACAEGWARAAPADRAALLSLIHRRLAAVAPRIVAASLRAKRAEGEPLAEAEEWLFLACSLRAVRILGRSYRTKARRVAAVRHADSGDVLRVFPTAALDRVVYPGMRGEVRLRSAPGAQARQLPVVRDGPRALPAGRVVAVLGAGNASMLAINDVLHQLFVETRTVVLKPNPVNDYLVPLFEEAFGDAIAAGLLRIVHGGAAVGRRLIHHPAVDAVHVTGSAATFQAIVDGFEGTRLPGLSAELGNVSPVIVVPGRWSPHQLEVQARHLATWLVANAGFGCLTPRVLIMHRGWPQRHDLLEHLRRTLEQVRTRVAYYPGASSRHARFVAAHPEAALLGDGPSGSLPWTLIAGVDPSDPDDICFREEAFCGLLAATALPAPSVATFLDGAVTFANETLWGSLNATILVAPSSLRDVAVRAAVGRAVRRLRYGCVTLNAPAYAAYHLQVLPWGAHPDRDERSGSSGCGKTADALLLGNVERSVLTGRFAGRPHPITVSASRPDRFARAVAAYEAMSLRGRGVEP